MSNGIDHGNGMTNINHDNGIRYGVIPVNDVTQAWSDSSEAEYGCDDCEMKREYSETQEELPEDERDDDCDEFDCSQYECEPIAFIVDDGKILATQGGDDSDIFILKSPFFTYAAFCSPCAPGACHLRNPLDATEYRSENNKCYCFDKDWFDTETPCPYSYWSVETGELVYEPKED